MNNNLEFENTDPSPDSVEDNHPRTNYGEGYYEEPKQETLKEAVVIEKIAMDKLKNKWGHLYTFGYPQRPFPTNYENDLNNIKIGLYEGAEWQAERMYSEEDMIFFAEFVATYSDKNKNVHGQMLHAKSKYDGAERTIDLFKIWLYVVKNKNLNIQNIWNRNS
jgi:hypothetical protein